MMEVKGAYTTIKDFLHTYKECKIISSFSGTEDNQWSFESERIIKIPDYQREFRWQLRNLEDLFSDINRGKCYLGQIAVSHKIGSKYYNIVDGQQRITSIVILLTVLMRQFYIYQDTLNLQKFELLLEENNIDVANDDRKPRMSFEANCFSDFQSFLARMYTDLDITTESFNNEIFGDVLDDAYDQKERYIDACTAFNRILISNLALQDSIPDKLSYVKDVIENIYNTRISVVVFEGDSIGESERVFLDINEKGLRLDNEDILKAYYFQAITGDAGDLALNTWTKLKKNYFALQKELKTTTKTSLDVLMNFMLQVSLFTDQKCSYDFEKFDNDLRYGSTNKKHICRLFTDSQLQTAFEKSAELLDTLKNLIAHMPNSEYYCTYLSNCDSTTRPVFHMLLGNVCKADMKIVFIVLAKIWWIRKNSNQKLSIQDIVQIFSFYIISNISGIKKEKSIVSKSFIASKSIESAYAELFSMEKELLSESSEKSLTLKRDQEKAEYLSFNIQMFYNDFRFNSDNKRWEISLSNQEFITKNNINRPQYAKDHFIIQNTKNIKLFDGSIFVANQSMAMLKKRAYNFIYHKDTYGDVDFVTRLNFIKSKLESDSSMVEYGAYEIAYFDFVSKEFQSFYKEDTAIPTWEEALEKYKANASRDYPKLVSYILQERSPSWNKHIGTYLGEQLP